MTESYLRHIQILTKDITDSWSESRGIAPDSVADKVDTAMFDWMNDLTGTLGIWIDKGLDMTDGELILAHANLGSLVECWLRFFYCAFYEEYVRNPYMKHGKGLDPDDKHMDFEYLKQHSKGILWDDCRDPLYLWIDKIQQHRNAIHAFRYREIGSPADFLLDLDSYRDFIETISNRLPSIEEYRTELLSSCY